MINREHTLPLTHQCRILNLSRSGVYYLPVPVSGRDRELMNLIDRIHLEEPYLGTRGIRNELWNKGHTIGRSHVRTLMRKMGVEAFIGNHASRSPIRAIRSIPTSSRG